VPTIRSSSRIIFCNAGRSSASTFSPAFETKLIVFAYNVQARWYGGTGKGVTICKSLHVNLVYVADNAGSAV